MSDDAYSLTERSIRELRRLLQTQQSEMINLRRKIARVEVPRQIYKPFSLTWFTLSEPLYPPLYTGTPVNSAVGYESQWDATTRRWYPKFPYVEQDIYSTSYSIGAPKHAVIACQQNGGRWEAVAGAPIGEVVFYGFDDAGSAWDTVGSGKGLKEGTDIYNDHSAWLGVDNVLGRYITQGYTAEEWDHDAAESAPQTNGNFLCNHAGTWEIGLEIEGFQSEYNSGSPPYYRTTAAENTGAASAGTAHTHKYVHPAVYTKPSQIQPKLWRKDASGGAIYTSGQTFMLDNIPFSQGMYWHYFGRTHATFAEGDRVGIELLMGLVAVQHEITNLRITFRMIDVGPMAGRSA